MRQRMATAHLFLDQIEEELAVLTEPDGAGEEYILPLSDLPSSVQEGAWLTVEIPMPYTVASYAAAVQEGREEWPEFTVDEAMGEAAREQIQALIDELSS